MDNMENNFEEPLEVATSFMIAVPGDIEELKDMPLIIDNLEASKDFEVINIDVEEKIIATVKYKDEEYEVEMFPVGLEIPEMYKTQHFFSDLDIEKIENTEAGLLIAMGFSDNEMDSYHLQLKIAAAVFSNLVAVVDDSSEKILSGKWVNLAAKSSVTPAPRYMYTVQAIMGEDDTVWLHTHGLNRCGLPEFEIVGSSEENYNNHFSIIDIFAQRLLEAEEMIEEGEPVYTAMVTNEIPLYATMINWEDGLELYPDDIFGGKATRDEGHMGDSCLLFCYPTPDALENGEYVPVNVFDDYIGDNPLFMISNQETARMKALAAERIEYVINMSNIPETGILLKVGLDTDEEFKDNAPDKEHIWFEFKKLEGGSIIAELTQEPYYVKDLHPGDEKEVSFADITDWLIFKDQRRYSPDDAYMLDSYIK